MSMKATLWAWKQADISPIQKIILLYLAERSREIDESAIAWPSYAAIADATGADIKSVKASIKHLAGIGVIEDSGDRTGATRRVIVWRLVGALEDESNKPKNGTGPKTESFRFSRETGPKTDAKRAQKRAPESLKEPLKEPLTPLTPLTPAKTAKSAWLPDDVDLPEHVPRDIWVRFCRHRREIRKPIRPSGCSQILGNLAKWHANGHDATAIIETSISNGWQGLFEPKSKPPAFRDHAQPRMATRREFH